jgi:hypothetical protein
LTLSEGKGIVRGGRGEKANSTRGMKNLSILGAEEKKNNILHHFVPNEILCQKFSKFLSIQDASLFDIAMCNGAKRPLYLVYRIEGVSMTW